MKTLNKETRMTIGAIIFVLVLITLAYCLVNPQIITKFSNSMPFIVSSLFVVVAILFKPMRKTIGLLLVILGTLACLTFFGLPVGIPVIIVGGLMLFL